MWDLFTFFCFDKIPLIVLIICESVAPSRRERLKDDKEPGDVAQWQRTEALGSMHSTTKTNKRKHLIRARSALAGRTEADVLCQAGRHLCAVLGSASLGLAVSHPAG